MTSNTEYRSLNIFAILHLMFRILLLAIIFLSVEPSSDAAPIFRCGQQIRTRPCNMEFVAPKRSKLRIPRSGTPRAELRIASAKLSNQTFQYLSSHDGLWRGYVAGSPGTVRLYLQIFSSAKPEAPRKIGEVRLLGVNHPVKFTYRSALPSGRGWTWQVVASPTDDEVLT